MKCKILVKMVLALVVMVSLGYCTKKAEKTKLVVDLENSYLKAQEELSSFDAKIKAAVGDEGLTIKYNYDKELAKSRVERLKEQLKTLSPDSISEASGASATGGDGHGSGH